MFRHFAPLDFWPLKEREGGKRAILWKTIKGLVENWVEASISNDVLSRSLIDGTTSYSLTRSVRKEGKISDNTADYSLELHTKSSTATQSNGGIVYMSSGSVHGQSYILGGQRIKNRCSPLRFSRMYLLVSTMFWSNSVLSSCW